MKKITLHLIFFLFTCLTIQQHSINAMEISTNTESNEQQEIQKTYHFLCDFCSQGFNRKDSLNAHIRGVHALQKTQYPCKQCTRSFLSQSCLTRHEHIHGEKKEYPCTECTKSFSLKNSLTVHMLRHKDLLDKTFLYPQYNKICADNNYPVMHMQTESKKSFLCEECNRDFTRNDNLKLHKIKFHGKGEIHHQCKQCPKTFATHIGLTGHIKNIHNKIIPQNISPLLIETSPYYMPLENLLFEDAIQMDPFPTYTPQLEWNNQ